MKHSDKNNPDHQALVSAIASIREVMTHINEDKRKTEGQVVLFDIFNDIDNCPVSIIIIKFIMIITPKYNILFLFYYSNLVIE